MLLQEHVSHQRFRVYVLNTNDFQERSNRRRSTKASTNSSATLPGLIVNWVVRWVSCQDGWWAAMHKTTQRYHVGWTIETNVREGEKNRSERS